ncbi:hypothetical protein ACFVWG_35260 [Kribbella sp. NPDC058245]|uniref:hypothetical protein n=1 Tax=Kribbella sp. NPDC058245 TaxID=3346399 RepID=UPI0036E735B0
MRRVWLAILLLVGVVTQAGVLAGQATAAAPPPVRVLDAGQRTSGYYAVANGPASFEVSTSAFLVSYNGILNGPGRLQFGDRCWLVIHTIHPSLTNAYTDLTPAGDFRLIGPGVGVLWHSNTAGLGGKHLMLTRDANLILTTASGKVVWQSTSSQCWLNANSVLASKQSLRSGWTKNTTPKPWLVLTVQANGNLVLRYGSTIVWQVRPNVPGAYLRFTADGELILRSPSGQALWRSGRHASTGCACWLRLDPYAGQISVVDYSGRTPAVIWKSPLRPPV